MNVLNIVMPNKILESNLKLQKRKLLYNFLNYKGLKFTTN
jgi:hypothetical protein